MKLNKFAAAILAFFPASALAHERWVNHELVQPIDAAIFNPAHPAFQSLLLRTIAFIAAIIGVWVLRFRISDMMERRGAVLRHISAFVFRNHGLLNLKFAKTIEDAALRLPALVLVYSAAGGFLIMPTFPVPPDYMNLARFIQALLAVFIVADLFLPVVGACIFAVIGLIFLHYGLAAVDVLPVCGIAYLYLTTKVRRPDVLLQASQVKVTRVIIGLSFMALGVMKILLPEIIVGVADHYGGILEDPLILPFWTGTEVGRNREFWALGFAFSEMLTGGLIAFGIFARPLALIGSFVFTKLMLSSFGWLEFPHIFPIACLLLVAFHPSKRQNSVLQKRALTPLALQTS